MKFFASLMNSTTSWSDFVFRARGRPSISSDVRDIPHPAASLLENIRTEGVPYVRNGPNWSLDQRDEAMASPGYPSTMHYLGFVETELVDMVKKGYFVVLPYKMVRHLDDLRLSQPGVVPQAERRPRTIIDYKESGVDDATVPLAPKESMQFGRTLDRLLHTILTAEPSHGPVYLMKHDVADGFYRLFLQPHACLALAMVVPV